MTNIALTAKLLHPDDEAYDSARALWNGMIDKRPAAIARCSTAADVIDAVNYARENGLRVSARGGGHGVAGTALSEGGLVVDLSAMKGIEVDPRARVARVEPGVTLGELDAATQAHGLATPLGVVSQTGVAGLTLGGGIGWLRRKHGLTADNVLSYEVATADGRLVTASASEHADLYWGLRGGGAGLGIVTSFEYRLHELGPIVAGGLMVYPRGQAPQILRALREHMVDAPDEVGSGFAFLTAPPEEFVPEEVRGQPVFGVIFLYAGPVEEGTEAATALKRNLGEPALDLVGPMPYTAVQQLLDAGNPPGRHQYWKSDNLAELSDEAIDMLFEHANRTQSPFSIVVGEMKGGAIDRVDEGAVALPGRNAAAAFYGIAQWEDPAESDAHIAWVRELGEAMKPFGKGNVALNFVMDEGQERVQSTFGPEKYRRLVELKDKYDPDNVFRMNQNIRPRSA
jgi:FAD/FMN-containing dehydrogenase